MPMHQMWSTMPFGMLLVWLLVIVVVVVSIVLLVRGLQGPARSNQSEGRAGALQILEERFARGEIDATEFEERRRVLRS